MCVKKIPDPEIPPAKFRLESQSLRVIPPEGIPPVMNPYDEQAVELALRLKDKHGSEVTVLTIDNETSPSVLKHALAMGAEAGIALVDPAFEGSDSFATAYILSRAVKKIGEYDLVLCGRQAADWDEGLVGTILAEKLGAPLVTLAYEVDLEDGECHVKRALLDGYQVFALPFPSVLTVSNEVGQPRLPSGWGIIAASQKEIPAWNAADIGADPARIGAGASRRTLAKLYIPQRDRRCELIEGETASEAAAELAETLVKKGIIQGRH
ncbi:MAG: electron transfer flavoprotein subunit beta/FixA family protein [Candidatus Aminicenantes bacterium]